MTHLRHTTNSLEGRFKHPELPSNQPCSSRTHTQANQSTAREVAIDVTSITLSNQQRPKYMGWYDKNGEEMYDHHDSFVVVVLLGIVSADSYPKLDIVCHFRVLLYVVG
jgi:hypothetical protein